MTQLILEGESDKIAQIIEFAKDLKLAFHTDTYPSISFDEAKAEVTEVIALHKENKGGFHSFESIFE